MAETVQSLEGLANLKPAAPEAPQCDAEARRAGPLPMPGKLQERGRPRVWIKPGSGKIIVNTKTVEVFFARRCCA